MPPTKEQITIPPVTIKIDPVDKDSRLSRLVSAFRAFNAVIKHMNVEVDKYREPQSTAPTKDQIANAPEYADKILSRSQFQKMGESVMRLGNVIAEGYSPLSIAAQLSSVVRCFATAYEPCPQNEQATCVLDFLAESLLRTVSSDERLRVLLEDAPPRKKETSFYPSPDLHEVVSQFTRLVSWGNAILVGLCPFHKEKTPSFSVRPGEGSWNCLGCGKGGDVGDFLLLVQADDFVNQAAEKEPGTVGAYRQ